MRQTKLIEYDEDFEKDLFEDVQNWFDLILYGIEYADFYWTLDAYLEGWVVIE